MGLATISLFSGCGGFDLGVMMAGHEVIWANDISLNAADTYRKNFPNIEFIPKNVRMVKEFPDADLVVGCYPCQGFSMGGNRLKDDRRNMLYLEFLRCLRQVQPRFFVAENVGGMKKLYNGRFLHNQLKVYSEAGYKVKHKLLNAKHYGVPQERKRIFIVGVREDINFEYKFPEPTHGPGLGEYVTLRDAIGDLPPWPEGEYYNGDFPWYYLSRNRKRGWEGVSYCIIANWRHVPLHPLGKPMRYIGPDKWELPKGRHRRLSYRECARLQTFPDWFEVTGSLRSKYAQIGNAVPPLLARQIVRQLPQC